VYYNKDLLLEVFYYNQIKLRIFNYVIKKMKIKMLDWANMDIDLISEENTSWKQMKCPWNEAEWVNIHKCAVKNTSICPYFGWINYLDTVECCYPEENKMLDEQ